MNWTLLLVAHGTVRSLDELPAFVTEIRRGRPAPPDLIEELRHRYELVGGSPLLRITRDLARAVEDATHLPTRVAMRLWEPRVADVLRDLAPHDRVCLIPLAPFSVPVYEAAARASLRTLAAPPELFAVDPYGEEEALLDAWTRGIRETAGERLEDDRTSVILTAHSLPKMVIERGDDYAERFERTARLVEARLGRPCRIAYQSQGRSDEAWLGPSLLDTFHEVQGAGAKLVVVAPVGFLAEHIETLYDLDVEARAQAGELGLDFHRVPALDVDSGLVRTIAGLVERVRARVGGPDRELGLD